MYDRNKMKNITIILPEIYINVIETLIKRGIIANRSEGVRMAIREFLNKKNEPKKSFKGVNMKIITVNLPESYIKAIDKQNLYPSRSDLIRVAIRDFLKHKLTNLDIDNWVLNTFQKWDDPPKEMRNPKSHKNVEPPEEEILISEFSNNLKSIHKKEVSTYYTHTNNGMEQNNLLTIPWKTDSQGNPTEVRTFRLIQK